MVLGDAEVLEAIGKPNEAHRIRMHAHGFMAETIMKLAGNVMLPWASRTQYAPCLSAGERARW